MAEMGLRLRLPCQPRLLFRAQGLVHRLCCPLEEAEGHREWSISVPCRLQPSAEVSDPRPPRKEEALQMRTCPLVQQGRRSGLDG